MKKFMSISELNDLSKDELSKFKGGADSNKKTEFFTGECTGTSPNLDSCTDTDTTVDPGTSTN